jgi:hypothetical protein
MGLLAPCSRTFCRVRGGCTVADNPTQLRILFDQLLVNECLPTPLNMWNRFGAAVYMEHTFQSNNGHGYDTR